MVLIGADYLRGLIAAGSGFSAKMVFNDRGAIVFPVQRQHREMKAEGISYEDEYRGNALAAMLMPGRIEVRYHRAYTDADVARMVRAIVSTPELGMMAGWVLTYQGRAITESGG